MANELYNNGRIFLPHTDSDNVAVGNKTLTEELEELKKGGGGESQYFSVRNGGALSSVANGRDKALATSVELYIKYVDSANGNIYGTGSTNMFRVNVSSGRINLGGLSGSDYNSFAFTPEEEHFYHIVMVYDGNVKKWYLDGNLVLTKNGVSFSGLADSLGTNAFVIRRIWGRALTEDEVAVLYNRGKPSLYSPSASIKESMLSSCTPQSIEDDGWVDDVTKGKLTFAGGVIRDTKNPFVIESRVAELEKNVSVLNEKTEGVDSLFCGNLYPQFDVINVNQGGHDCTFIGSDFVSSHYEKSGQAGVKGWSAFYYIDLESKTRLKTIYSQFLEDNSTWKILQLKSVDYNFGKLLVGNGRAKDADETTYEEQGSNIYIFNDVDSWKDSGHDTPSNPLTFENCGEYKKIDLSELGVKVYAFWAQRDDSVFVSCNFFKDIYLIKLGKGANNMGKGTFVSAESGKYNGSYLIVKHWHQDKEWIATNNEPAAGHGGQFYKGSLYIAENDTTSCKIYRCILCDNGKLKFDVIMLNEYKENVANLTSTYSYKYQYVDGVCFKDGKLYAQPLIHDGSYVYDSLLVAEV